MRLIHPHSWLGFCFLVWVTSGSALAQPGCGPCLPATGASFSAGSATGGGFVPLGGVSMPRPSLTGVGPALPDAADLDRLNLLTEWAAYVPLLGGADGFGTVQVADDTQIFIQTRAGLMVAIDAVTGAKQWSYPYPAGGVNLYPVGWNEELVFAVNVSRLIALRRTTGALAFDVEMPGSASTGPAADSEMVYVVLNGNRVIAYRFPPTLIAAPRATALDRGPRVNAATAVANRFATAAPAGGLRDVPEFPALVPLQRSTDVGVAPGQKTPSISVMPSITPPYTLSDRGLFDSPSIAVLPSLRRPYQLRPDYLRYNQQTPSIAVIPPSVARANELANFAPLGPRPTVAWTALTRSRVIAAPLLPDGATVPVRPGESPVQRAWFVEEDGFVEAFDRTMTSDDRRATKVPSVVGRLQADIAAPLAGPMLVDQNQLIGLAGLGDGNLIALDLLRGSPANPRTQWRATIGNRLDRTPVVTRDSVYAAGSQAGVARVDIATGAVLWRTEDSADLLLAVTDEFAYVRDRRGDLLVYDKNTPTIGANGRTQPLARLPIAGFAAPISNTTTDRILLAGEGGVLLSLRDASVRHALPTLLRPKLPPAPPPAPPPMPEPLDN